MPDEATSLLSFLRPEGALPAALVLLATGFAAHFFARSFERLSKRFTGRRILLQQVGTLGRLLVIFAGVFTAATQVFAFSRDMLLGIGGTVAVSVGFAFKDLVASTVAGIIILIDRPFQVGDRVAFGDTYGEIAKIGLRTTRLVTLDDNMVTIPNAKFLTDAVSSGNSGALSMQVVVDLLVSMDTELPQARVLVRDALLASPYTYMRKPWVLLTSQVVTPTYVALQLRIKAYVLDVQYEKAFQSDLQERLLVAFRDAGIRSPSPTVLSAA